MFRVKSKSGKFAWPCFKDEPLYSYVDAVAFAIRLADQGWHSPRVTLNGVTVFTAI